MGRKMRRVSGNWEHPKEEDGNYIPMHESFPYNDREVVEGLCKGWLKGDPPNYDVFVMPDWPEKERTHYQMYETCTEGTPISPVMESPEALARWLADNEASAFADLTASYESWLRVCLGGYAPSAIIGPQGLESGVEGLTKY